MGLAMPIPRDADLLLLAQRLIAAALNGTVPANDPKVKLAFDLWVVFATHAGRLDD